MMRELFLSMLETTLSVSLIAVLLILLGPWLNRRYEAKWKCEIWIFLAVLLLLPYGSLISELRVTANTTIQWLKNASQENDGVENNSLKNGDWEKSGQENGGWKLYEKSGAEKKTAQELFPADGEESNFTLPKPIQIEIPIRMTVPVFTGNKSTGSGISIIDIMAMLWLGGSLVFLSVHIGAYMRLLRKLRREGKPVKEEALLNQVETLREELGIRRKITVTEYSEAASPMITGFFRPLLILPTEKQNREELPFILWHELTHLKSGHMYMKLLFVTANALHWFNPVIAIIRREAAVDMELACDESVVRGQDYAFRRAYSETLLSAMHGQYARRLALSTQFYGGKKIMKKRFSQILNNKKEKNGLLLLLCIALLTLSAGALVGCSQGTVPIDYGHEVRVDVDGDGKTDRVWVSDTRSGDLVYTQLVARLGNGKEALVNYEGYYSSFLVAGDLSGNGKADILLVKADTGSTFGAMEVTALYFEEDRWVEYPYGLTANPEIDLYQPVSFWTGDGGEEVCIGATIVQKQERTLLRLIIPVDIIDAETVECVDVAWKEDGWQIEQIRQVENYYTERRAGDLLENTYEYGRNADAGSEDDKTAGEGLSDDELCRLALSYYEAHHNGHIPQVAVVDGVTPDGKVNIHLYDNAEGRSMTCDWYTVDRETGVGENLLFEEIRLLDELPSK